MYTDVSESYIERIGELSREFRARLSFSDTQDVVSDEIQSMQFTFGTCGAETFTIGSVFISYVTATVAKTDLQIAGQEFTPEIGLVIDDETVEYIPMGVFEAMPSNITKTKDRIQVTASDRIGSKCNVVYIPTISFPATIRSVLNDVENQAGVTILCSEDTTGIISKRMDAITCQEVLGYIAGLIGGFCYADRSGNVVLAAHPRQSAMTLHPDRFLSLNIAEHDHLISTLKVIVSDGGENPDGETIDPVSYEASTNSGGDYLTVANPYMTADIFAVMKLNVLDYTYRPGSAIFLGDPRIDPVDALELEDSNEDTYFFPCTHLVMDYDGGLTCTLTTPGVTSSDTSAVGPMGQRLERMAVSLILAENLIARKLTASQADLRYAKIDFANISVAAVQNLYTNFGVVTNIQIVDGKITGELDAVTVNGDLITAHTIVADRIIFTGTDGMYYALNANGAGGLTPQELEDIKYQSALDGSNLVAQSVTADQINVTNLFAQDIQFTGRLRSVKSAADDNSEGVFIGFEQNANAASFGVGSNTGNHVWYKGGVVDIQAESLTFTSGMDAEESITAAQQSVTANASEISRLAEQAAQIQQMFDQIQLWVSSIANKTAWTNGQDISAYETDVPPTLDNYPAAEEFWIWPICNTNIYCSDTLICGTNNYAAHLHDIAACRNENKYYIFDQDTTQAYYWRELTESEYRSLSNMYSAINIEAEGIELKSVLNTVETLLSLTPDGVVVTPGKLLCC